MREIKFRAWDKHLNLMVYAPNDNIFFPALSRQREIMQFTGLKDKNGKEIYEGDIIKVHEGNYPLNWWVEYNQLLFGYVRMWRRDKKDVSPTIYTDFKPSIIEVIGNIYENPELLNQ